MVKIRLIEGKKHWCEIRRAEKGRQAAGKSSGNLFVEVEFELERDQGFDVTRIKMCSIKEHIKGVSSENPWWGAKAKLLPINKQNRKK